MKFKLVLFVALATVILAACRNQAKFDAPPDTLKAPTIGAIDSIAKDTAKHTDTVAKSDLPPMAKVVEPEKLIPFLPTLDGWHAGDIDRELKVRDNFNSSRVGCTYTKDAEKISIDINDFAYVPFLYDPLKQYGATYLQEDNDERTETTTIKGYRAIQTWEKKDKHALIWVLPGKRFVIKVVMDGAKDVNEVRSFIEKMDLRGVEALN